MRLSIKRCLLLSVAMLMAGIGGKCHAELVWTIDSGVSFIRLNIPDQTVPLNEEGDFINALLRDFQVNGGPVFTGDPDIPAAWTDAGGRRSFVQGTLSSTYSEGSSIQFLGGTHNATAIQTGSFLPEPLGPAAFAADVWGTEVIDEENDISVFARLGNVRIRDIAYDLNGTVGLSEGPAGTWTQSSGGIDLGILAGALVDVDLAGLFVEFGLALDPFGGENQGNILVENIGGKDRRLTINVEIPVTFDLSGLELIASINGQIVAFATVPEPSSFLMLLVCGSCGLVRRRRVC